MCHSHPCGRRERALGRDSESDHEGEVLGAGSDRTAPASERQMGASHRCGRGLQVREHARGSKAILLCAPLQDFEREPALNIRTSEPLQNISAALLREVRGLDGNLALYEVITLQEQVDRSTSPQLVAVTLVSILAGLALLLAAVGLYGVMSYALAQSMRELGLRIALGAGSADVLRLVMPRGLRLTAGGVLLGAAAGLALTRLLGALLYNVSPRDPRAFGAAWR